MITRLPLFLILTCLWLTASSAPSNFNNSRTIFDELVREEVLEVTLRADFSMLLSDPRYKESEKGQFVYEDENGAEVARRVKLELRGKYRRRICQFPPLMIKFDKDELRALGLSDHNDLKLVTHCLDDKAPGNENVLREYLAYKLFNEISAKSYRVQLVRITYLDESGAYGRIKRYGFLIEDTDEMAERLGGLEFEGMNPQPSELAAADENLVAVFQYMIGNDDWSLQMARNIKLVKPKDESRPMIPVPYDFDFSGLVNASYAQPNVSVGVTSVRQRAFLGIPREGELLAQSIEVFENKKVALFRIVRDFKRLNGSARRDLLDYLQSFYNNLDVLREENQAQLEALNEKGGGEGDEPAPEKITPIGRK